MNTDDYIARIVGHCVNIMYAHPHLFESVQIAKKGYQHIKEDQPDESVYFIKYFLRNNIGLSYIARNIIEKTDHIRWCLDVSKVNLIEEYEKANIKAILLNYANFYITKSDYDKWQTMLKEENLI